MRAADIAERNLKRAEEAIAYLRAAWAIDPGSSQVFDALSVLLSPHAKDPESDPRNVRARIDLYTQAAQATSDPHRKIGLLEKLVAIWEDELCQPARAIEEIERVLAIDPGRRTAILALQRNAGRAGDAVKLARALQAEADITADGALQRRLLLQAAEVLSSRVGDRDRALALVDRALAVDQADEAALRARQRIDERAGKHEDARRSLLKLIQRDPNGEAAFGLWIEIAVVDEQRLKRPRDAVEAYRQAAKLRPTHPLPRIEIARLLREVGDHGKLVESLMGLAAKATDANDYARLLFQAAEVQELSIGNDEAALQSLAQADAHLAVETYDPAILEAMERIHVRRSSQRELAALYTRWLERKPPAAIDHALRVALAGVLAEPDKEQAIELLSGLRAVVPGHVPALRALEQLHRTTGAYAALAATLRAEAEVFSSRLARTGALWELVALEEELGTSATLDALERLVADAPGDVAALDAVARVAGKLVEGLGPHPTVVAVRAKLTAAIQARRELTTDGIAKAMLHIEEAILAEGRVQEDAAAARAARDGYREALTLWPDSLLAARGLDRLAQMLGDRASAIMSNVALAKLVDSGREKAGHLVRAAELTSEDGSREAQARALELYEQALLAYADSTPAATSIARMLAGDPGRLIDRLGEALGRAVVRGQIVLLGTEIGHATLRHKDTATVAPDPGVGVSAMRRVLAVAPNDVPALLLMARLLSAQRVWAEARDTLLHAVKVASEHEAIVAAQFMLADLYEGPLADLGLAEASLQAILALDGGNRRALEKLYQVAAARGDGALAIQALGRLVEIAPDPAGRVEADLRLAEACRKEGDSAGMVRALCDAMVTAPADTRPASTLSRLYRIDTFDGAAGYVKALQQALDIANARRLPIEARWLTQMGLLEVNVLMRPREGVLHLQQAVVLPGAPPDARAALGRGLEAANRNSEAITVLRDVLTSDAETVARLTEVGAALGALDAALAKEGRVEERLAVEEARACLGEVKPDRMAWLRGRRLPAEAPLMGSLAGAELARLLVPEARSPMIDVCVALAPVAAKALRFEIGSLGVSSRDRIGPRDGHPTRALADRLARALGIEAFELYLTPTWKGAARVYPGDPPAIVGPTSFVELPEPEQIFGLSRLLTRAALGFTWLDELSIEAADGLLLAALRSAVPTFGTGELTAPREQTVQGFLGPVQKAIGRRQRKLLEEIAPSASAAYDARSLTIGVRRSEYRVAYILTGDLLCAVDYLRRYDREIARSAEEPRVLLQHPVTNELVRYALTAESYAERRRVGTG
jgi:tetratricopeptide (TPR) repeat protein